MGRNRLLNAAVVGCVLLAGCFHQVVATGLPAGETKVEKPWTSTWIWGLVEAKPIDVRTQCPNGVAYVASKFTVMNWVGAAVTLGIWYPWTVTVTCAGGGRASLDASTTQVHLGDSSAEALDRAAKIARVTGEPVAIVWDVSTPGQPEGTR
ncbi:MAG: Bor/Iss family lipoprotein [Gemmatimonadaceae bacterium]